jgi:hypothetical protein
MQKVTEKIESDSGESNAPLSRKYVLEISFEEYMEKRRDRVYRGELNFELFLRERLFPGSGPENSFQKST